MSKNVEHNFTVEDLRKDLEEMTISECCKFRHLRIFNFFKYFEGEERKEIEKIYKEESSLKSYNPYLIKDAEIVREREKEKNYKPLPFDLKVGDKVVAWDMILECVSYFTILSIQEKTFFAVNDKGMKRSFFKSDYQFGKITKTDSTNSLNDFMFCENCGKLVKRTGKNQKYCEPCKQIRNRSEYNAEKYKQEKIKNQMPKNTIDNAIQECIEKKMTYAERQKLNTLKKEGHRVNE